ncbi:hypothetical protein HMPREF3293_00017 [Christensenella minuta]|uniref:Uncharacterized protein n=1 Tax=Christensenella minuta TaxID=626937 RepID=A0A136Q8T1_9FIRM|nr:hypothetical protein HMPREF3293_00017 [Christensenella minuta]
MGLRQRNEARILILTRGGLYNGFIRDSPAASNNRNSYLRSYAAA